MLGKIKNAPFVKDQPKGRPYEAYIIAGSEAWNKTHQQLVNEWTNAEIGYQAVILGEKELANIGGLKLPLDVGKVSVFRAGKLSQAEQSAICLNLAQHSTAETVAFYDEANQLLEDSSAYVQRLRNDEETKQRAESITPDAQRMAEYASLFEQMGDNEKLAEFIKWQGKPVRINDLSEEIYCFTGKKWEKLEDKPLGRKIRAFFQAKGITKYTANRIDNLIKLIKYEVEPMGKADPNLLAFANGVLHKQTGQFIPHSELHFLTSFINIDYFSTTTPTPNFDKWLNWVSDGKDDKRLRILAALYMILTNRYEWQLFLEITGAGGTGKSVFNHLAQILAGGDDNTASISLKDLENPTMRCGLIDKTLCYSPDQESYISDGGTLRAITGGDAISFRPLYKAAFKDRVKAIFLITGNSTLIFKEHKGGTSRRRVIFQFNKVVTEAEKDYQLPQKLEQEAAGIVRLLLDTFPDPAVAKILLEEQKHSDEALAVKEESDHILQFAKHFEARAIIDGLTLGNSKKTDAHKRALHSAYLYYCNCMGIQQPLQRNRFRIAFEQALKERGSHEILRTRIKDGVNITNIYYINMREALNEWDN